VRATDKGGISTSRVQRDLACRFDRLLTCRRGNGSSSFKWEGFTSILKLLGRRRHGRRIHLAEALEVVRRLLTSYSVPRSQRGDRPWFAAKGFQR